MTLLDVARFVETPGAVMYALTCEAWGIDPAEEIEDPWLKHQLRLGLLRAMRKHQETDVHDGTNDKRKDGDASLASFPLIDHRDRLSNAQRKLSQSGM